MGKAFAERCFALVLRRRLLVLRLATTGFVAPVGAGLAQGRKSPAPIEPELPGKNEPRPEQRRSGETDADRTDEAGSGRTDADPGDQPGRGRGKASTSDADPGDPAGQGRGAPPSQLRTGLPAKKA